MSNIRQDIAVINERLKKIYILYRKLKGSQGGGGGIESVKVNGNNIPVVDKEVNITVPTKTSDLTNDSDFTTNNKLNKEIQDRISADNLKLDAPTTNNTNEYVILGDGSTAPKNDFGKVDTVMGVVPDANKNVDISGIETNWTNENQRWSNLPNKSADATYNKVMVLDNQGKAGTKNLDYAIPYEGANKAINLNTQKLLTDGIISTSNGNNVINLVSKVVAYNKSTNSIVFEIKGSGDSRLMGTYSFELFRFLGVSYKFNITSYFYQNNWHVPSVTWVSGISSDISSVNLLKKSDSEFYIEIIFTSSYSYTSAKVSWLGNQSALNHEFNLYRGSEVDLTTSAIIATITPSKFKRDSYLLDFRNFTNVPNFAQSADVFKKNEATNWTNASQRFSGLVDKSADATYNKVMMLDADGKAGVKNLNSDTLIDILTNATPEKITQIKTLLGV